MSKNNERGPDLKLSTPVRETPSHSELQAQVDLLNNHLGKLAEENRMFEETIFEIMALETSSTEAEAIKALLKKAGDDITKLRLGKSQTELDLVPAA